MRIVSLVPSITETLFDFGLNHEHVVGRTKFCIHPKNVVEKVPIIGGTKNLNIEKIKALNPDLIIANKEENVKEQVEELMKDFDVMLTNIETIEDNYYFIKSIGRLLHQEEKAQKFYLKAYESLYENKASKPYKIAYLIWKDPYMTVGNDTFIHHILTELGLDNQFKNQNRYPEIQVTDLEKADVILLSSEPYPFKEKHLDELKAQFPTKKILLVDGEAFSWFGTRIAKCGNYYKELLQEIEN